MLLESEETYSIQIGSATCRRWSGLSQAGHRRRARLRHGTVPPIHEAPRHAGQDFRVVPSPDSCGAANWRCGHGRSTASIL